MMPVPAGTRVWLASGVTDMRKGWSSLSLLVQEQMKLDPHTGHLFVFRGRQGGLDLSPSGPSFTSRVWPFHRKASGLRANSPVLAEMAGDVSAFGGKLYPREKLTQLVNYLNKRGVAVYETRGNPHFIGKPDGTGAMALPANPTVLQVKHELSHFLDFRKLGPESYANMGRTSREVSVLNRLQNNRSWATFNDAERGFSIRYVDDLKAGSQ